MSGGAETTSSYTLPTFTFLVTVSPLTLLIHGCVLGSFSRDFLINWLFHGRGELQVPCPYGDERWCTTRYCCIHVSLSQVRFEFCLTLVRRRYRSTSSKLENQNVSIIHFTKTYREVTKRVEIERVIPRSSRRTYITRSARSSW